MIDQQKCQRGHDKIIHKFRPYINGTCKNIVYICHKVVQWTILTIFKLYCHIYEFTAQCKDSANYLPYY